jgi:hypothetical protein
MPFHHSFSDWLKTPRDFETFTRSLQRKILGLDTRSSFPLLSGNTFAAICEINLDVEFEKSDFDLCAIRNFKGKAFLTAGSGDGNVKKLIQACKSGLNCADAELIIHNGDVIPSEAEMRILASAFQRVYSVNWLGDFEIAQPIPIGLENRDKRRNGVPSDFLKEMRLGLPSHDSRDITLLACFSLHTNYRERSIALENARGVSGVKLVTEPITPKEYRKLLLRSKFVLSPPGNGPDCHRTWEALYLGAIPIVLRNSWPFSNKNIPALVVESWNNLEQSISKPLPKHNELWKELPYWIPS